MRKIKIRVKNLSKSFGNKKVLNNLNLNIYESESLAIIGESGTGKSVLTTCIDGLENYDLGTISYENIENIRNLSNIKKNEYMGKFGILFQNAALFDSLTVEENLKFCKKNNFKKILNDVALPESLLKEYPNNLSIGVQKIGLAEPFLKVRTNFRWTNYGLDPIIGKQINSLIKELVKEKKVPPLLLSWYAKCLWIFWLRLLLKRDQSLGMENQRKLKRRNKSLLNFINGFY